MADADREVVENYCVMRIFDDGQEHAEAQILIAGEMELMLQDGDLVIANPEEVVRCHPPRFAMPTDTDRQRMALRCRVSPYLLADALGVPRDHPMFGGPVRNAAEAER